MESRPEFVLMKQTNTKGAFKFSALMTVAWIFMLVLTFMKADLNDPLNRNGFIGLHIIIGLIVIIPVIFGFLRKELTLIFKVDEPKGALILESHWGNYLTFSKYYPLKEIKGFEVHNVIANKKGTRYQTTQNQLLALCFQSNRPKYLTNFLDNENSTEFAQNLNKFLADNTQIRITSQSEHATPYTRKSQEKFLYIILAFTFIVIVGAIVTVIVLLVSIK